MNTIEEWKRQKKRQRSSLLVSWVIIYSIPCCASYSVLPWTILPFLSNHPGAIHPLIKIVQCKTAKAARNWINSSSSVFILLLWWTQWYSKISCPTLFKIFFYWVTICLSVCHWTHLMSEKKSNQAKENLPNVGGGNAAKVVGKIRQNINNSAESWRQRTRMES